MTKSLRYAAEIIIGKVGAPRGLDGTVRIIPLTDFDGRFDALKKISAMKFAGDDKIIAICG